MNDKEKIERIRDIIAMAERWSAEQLMPETDIVMSALKDIRRVVNDKQVSTESS